MKTLLTFLLFLFISIYCYSQENPKLNFGIGYPFFLPKSNYSNSGGYVYIERNKLNLFAEIPGLFTFKKNPEFMISPGLSYVFIGENQSGGGLGGGGYTEYLRSALSIYTKLLYQPEIQFLRQNNWNFGLTTGYYLYTHAKGHSEWWRMESPHNINGSTETDTDSKAFFKSFYFGFTTSFQFNFEKVKHLKPGFEFTFYPDYANIFDHYSGNSNTKISHNMYMGSLIIGLGSKKLFKQ